MEANTRIQELYQQIVSLRFSDAPKVLTLCEELSFLADQTGDVEAKAHALHFISDAYLTLNQTDNALHYCTESINYMMSHDTTALLGYAYNLIAIIFGIRHDTLTSLSYYLKALDYAQKDNDKRLLHILYNNIGSIFSDYDFEFESKYIFMANQNIEHIAADNMGTASDASVQYNYEVQVVNFATSLLNCGKYQEALEQISSYLMQCESHTPQYHHISFYYVRLIAYSKLGLIYDMQHVSKEFIAYLLKEDIGCVDCALLFPMVKELLLTGLHEDAFQIMTFLASSPTIKENAIDCCMLSQLFIQYYQQKGNQDALLTNYRKFFKYQREKSAILQNDYIISIDNKIALEKELKINQFYKEDSKQLEELTVSDSLTGLYNRYGLNKYYRHNFDACKKMQQEFGLIIIDIDHFKGYNDTMGHLLGDECLKQLANILKHSTGSDYFCARYGGDEFFVVCRDVQYEDFQATIHSIVQSVREASLPHPENESGHVTISVGAVLAIPEGKQTISEFIASADDALYRVKKASRNNYYIKRTLSKE